MVGKTQSLHQQSPYPSQPAITITPLEQQANSTRFSAQSKQLGERTNLQPKTITPHALDSK